MFLIFLWKHTIQNHEIYNKLSGLFYLHLIKGFSENLFFNYSVVDELITSLEWEEKDKCLYIQIYMINSSQKINFQIKIWRKITKK